MRSEKPHQIMPDIVRAICWNYGAWIVGSRAANLYSSSDWDLIVHPECWMKAAILLRTQGHIEANSFGGWKVDHCIDVWPSTIDAYISNLRKTDNVCLWNPKLNILLKTHEIET